MTLKHKYFAHFDAVKSLTVEGNKKLLLSTGRDGSVRLWDCKEGLKPIASLVGHHDNVVRILLFQPKAVFVPSSGITVASGAWD